jgi:SNF2 family DNA or RNA helicase
MIENAQQLKDLKSCYFQIVTFGKFKGRKLHELPDDYVKYLCKSASLDYVHFRQFQELSRSHWFNLKFKTPIKTDDIDSSLYQHQKDFLIKTKDKNSYGMFFEMGTGKTRTALEFMRLRPIDKVLIVCPKIVFSSWYNEIIKYLKIDDIHISIITGTKTQKKEKASIKAKFYITNYETLLNDDLFNTLINQDFDGVIFDESHKIKSYKAQITKKSIALSCHIKYRLCLSGTPITNSKADIFTQSMVIDHGQTFGTSYYSFMSEYYDKQNTGFGYVDYTENPQKMAVLSQKLKSICSFVKKSDCVDLPEKVRIYQDVTLSKKAQKYYKDILKRVKIILDDSEILTTQKIVEILRLRMITSGFLYSYNSKEKRQINQISTEKTDATIELVSDSSQPVVIICNFQAEITNLLKAFSKAKIEASAIYGKTSQSEKDKTLSLFQDGKLKAVILQLDAASIGIDGLQNVSSTMIFYSINYRYDSLVQAEDRIHRVGQNNKCTYIYLTGRLPDDKATIDNTVINIINNKKTSINSFIEEIRSE